MHIYILFLLSIKFIRFIFFFIYLICLCEILSLYRAYYFYIFIYIIIYIALHNLLYFSFLIMNFVSFTFGLLITFRDVDRHITPTRYVRSRAQ